MSEDIPSGPARTGFTPNLVVGIGVTLLGVLLTLDKLQVTNALAWLPVLAGAARSLWLEHRLPGIPREPG